MNSDENSTNRGQYWCPFTYKIFFGHRFAIKATLVLIYLLLNLLLVLTGENIGPYLLAIKSTLMKIVLTGENIGAHLLAIKWTLMQMISTKKG